MDSEGNRSFVSALVKSHGVALRRFLAVRMRHGVNDLPDLVQEVYLRLLRIPNHEAIRNPQAYLYTVASHVLHQHALGQSALAEPIDPMDLAASLIGAAPEDPAECAQIEQRFEVLGKDLEERFPRAYAALMLYRYEGATLEEIGNRLGVSRVMAKKYLLKAMTFCKERLDEME